MSRDRALTPNARNVRQLNFARKHNERREVLERDDLRLALAHPPTRRLLMRILFEARCDLAHVGEDRPELSASTYDVSAKIHYHTGRRDLGLLIEGWIAAADPRALVEMLAEQVDRALERAAELAAAHTTPSTGASS